MNISLVELMPFLLDLSDILSSELVLACSDAPSCQAALVQASLQAEVLSREDLRDITRVVGVPPIAWIEESDNCTSANAFLYFDQVIYTFEGQPPLAVRAVLEPEGRQLVTSLEPLDDGRSFAVYLEKDFLALGTETLAIDLPSEQLVAVYSGFVQPETLRISMNDCTPPGINAAIITDGKTGFASLIRLANGDQLPEDTLVVTFSEPIYSLVSTEVTVDNFFVQLVTAQGKPLAFTATHLPLATQAIGRRLQTAERTIAPQLVNKTGSLAFAAQIVLAPADEADTPAVVSVQPREGQVVDGQMNPMANQYSLSAPITSNLVVPVIVPGCDNNELDVGLLFPISLVALNALLHAAGRLLPYAAKAWYAAVTGSAEEKVRFSPKWGPIVWMVCFIVVSALLPSVSLGSNLPWTVALLPIWLLYGCLFFTLAVERSRGARRPSSGEAGSAAATLKAGTSAGDEGRFVRRKRRVARTGMIETGVALCFHALASVCADLEDVLSTAGPRAALLAPFALTFIFYSALTASSQSFVGRAEAAAQASGVKGSPATEQSQEVRVVLVILTEIANSSLAMAILVLLTVQPNWKLACAGSWFWTLLPLILALGVLLFHQLYLFALWQCLRAPPPKKEVFEAAAEKEAVLDANEVPVCEMAASASAESVEEKQMSDEDRLLHQLRKQIDLGRRAGKSADEVAQQLLAEGLLSPFWLEVAEMCECQKDSGAPTPDEVLAFGRALLAAEEKKLGMVEATLGRFGADVADVFASAHGREARSERELADWLRALIEQTQRGTPLSRAVPELVRMSVTREYDHLYGKLPADEQKLQLLRRLANALEKGPDPLLEMPPPKLHAALVMEHAVLYPDAMMPTPSEILEVMRKLVAEDYYLNSALAAVSVACGVYMPMPESVHLPEAVREEVEKEFMARNGRAPASEAETAAFLKELLAATEAKGATPTVDVPDLPELLIAQARQVYMKQHSSRLSCDDMEALLSLSAALATHSAALAAESIPEHLMLAIKADLARSRSDLDEASISDDEALTHLQELLIQCELHEGGVNASSLSRDIRMAAARVHNAVHGRYALSAAEEVAFLQRLLDAHLAKQETQKDLAPLLPLVREANPLAALMGEEGFRHSESEASGFTADMVRDLRDSIDGFIAAKAGLATAAAAAETSFLPTAVQLAIEAEFKRNNGQNSAMPELLGKQLLNDFEKAAFVHQLAESGGGAESKSLSHFEANAELPSIAFSVHKDFETRVGEGERTEERLTLAKAIVDSSRDDVTGRARGSLAEMPSNRAMTPEEAAGQHMRFRAPTELAAAKCAARAAAWAKLGMASKVTVSRESLSSSVEQRSSSLLGRSASLLETSAELSFNSKGFSRTRSEDSVPAEGSVDAPMLGPTEELAATSLSASARALSHSAGALMHRSSSGDAPPPPPKGLKQLSFAATIAVLIVLLITCAVVLGSGADAPSTALSFGIAVAVSAAIALAAFCWWWRHRMKRRRLRIRRVLARQEKSVGRKRRISFGSPRRHEPSKSEEMYKASAEDGSTSPPRVEKSAAPPSPSAYASPSHLRLDPPDALSSRSSSPEARGVGSSCRPLPPLSGSPKRLPPLPNIRAPARLAAASAACAHALVSENSSSSADEAATPLASAASPHGAVSSRSNTSTGSEPPRLGHDRTQPLPTSFLSSVLPTKGGAARLPPIRPHARKDVPSAAGERDAEAEPSRTAHPRSPPVRDSGASAGAAALPGLSSDGSTDGSPPSKGARVAALRPPPKLPGVTAAVLDSAKAASSRFSTESSKEVIQQRIDNAIRRSRASRANRDSSDSLAPAAQNAQRQQQEKEGQGNSRPSADASPPGRKLAAPRRAPPEIPSSGNGATLADVKSADWSKSGAFSLAHLRRRSSSVESTSEGAGSSLRPPRPAPPVPKTPAKPQ